MDYKNQIISRCGKTLVLSVRVLPGARRSGIEGIWNETAVKVVLRAPAVEGKANTALIDFLSETCGVRKNMISILSGDKSRCKRVSVTFSSDESAAMAVSSLECLIGL